MRISHDALDDNLRETVEACLEELDDLGILADPSDPRVLSAVKLYAHGQTDLDATRAAKYLERYDRLKACLQMSSAHRQGGGCSE